MSLKMLQLYPRLIGVRGQLRGVEVSRRKDIRKQEIKYGRKGQEEVKGGRRQEEEG